ncbi:MAG: pentapeptide repeat-containing protein [Armatimonadetes bacterium]|nr:pentapeptide repeat-containing protein [Armatimonadota bacterium]
MKRAVRFAILTVMATATVTLVWARPWAWQPIRQAQTGRLLHRAWLGPWRPVPADAPEPDGAVDRLVLAGVTLPQADFRHWRMSNAQFANSNLPWANGERLTLWYSRLAHVRLVAAQLDHARLSHVEISDSNLRGAKARGAYLSNSQLLRVDLREADLRGAAVQQTDMLGPVDLRDADLRGAVFADADMRLARLDGARMEGARYLGNTRWPAGFDPASRGMRDGQEEQERRRPSSRQQLSLPPNSSAAVLTDVAPQAELDGYQFFSADLGRALLRGASLRDSVLCYATLHAADLRDTDLRRANLTGVDLTGADLTGARLDGAVLDGCSWDSRTRWPEGFQPPHALARDETQSISQASMGNTTRVDSRTP